MSSVNKVILIGNLGADPEMRYTSGGNAVCNLRLATSRNFKTKDGSRQEETEWHRITVWGKQAESCKEYLAKGRQVYVEGRLQTRKWEDRDGNERYTTETVAERVQFLSGKDREDSGEGRRASSGRSRQAPPSPALNDDDIPF